MANAKTHEFLRAHHLKMTPEEQNQLAELIEKRLEESITDSEAADVEAKLKASKEARRLFLDLTSQHANLQMLGDSLTIEKLTHHEKPYSIRALAAAAAVVIAVHEVGEEMFGAAEPRPARVRVEKVVRQPLAVEGLEDEEHDVTALPVAPVR